MRAPHPARMLAVVTIVIGLAGTRCARSAENTGSPEPPATAVCQECHAEQTRFHAYGGHADVPCAKCHDVRGDHIETEIAPRMPGNAHCLECHVPSGVPANPSRPLTDAQMLERHLAHVEQKHVIEVDRKKVKSRCLHCHDPHLGR